LNIVAAALAKTPAFLGFFSDSKMEPGFQVCFELVLCCCDLLVSPIALLVRTRVVGPGGTGLTTRLSINNNTVYTVITFRLLRDDDMLDWRCAMGQRQQFSHGLLYSVLPDDLSSLHLQDESGRDGFEWAANESQYSGHPISEVVLSFLKKTAADWGLVKF